MLSHTGTGKAPKLWHNSENHVFKEQLQPHYSIKLRQVYPLILLH